MALRSESESMLHALSLSLASFSIAFVESLLNWYDNNSVPRDRDSFLMTLVSGPPILIEFGSALWNLQQIANEPQLPIAAIYNSFQKHP